MKRIIPVIFIISMIFQMPALAQSWRLGIEGGALITMGPEEFKSGAPEGLGLKNGLSFGIKAKGEIPSSTFRISCGINYSIFSAEENYVALRTWELTQYYPEPIIELEKSAPEKTSANTPGDMRSETSSHIISLGAGAEWKIFDWKASPYLAGGMFLNYYETKDIETDLFESANNAVFKDSGIRIGGFIGAGAEIKLIEKLDLDVFAKYNFYDLMNNSDMEGFVGESNNGFHALYAGAALLWRIL